MGKVKKSKFRKCINRLKNFLRYARKRCSIHVLPVVYGCSVVLVTLFTSYQNTYATGLEEAFYYTYLDLMSGLYAQTGYELSFKDEYYTKPERASAKDVWDNFCTWVERKAQVLSLPVRIVNDTVFNELQNLPNVVTQAGATMSEDLSELLATVLPATAYDDMVNQFDTSSIESINKVVSNLTGGGYLSSTQAKAIMNGEALLNIVYDPSNGRYMAYALSLTYGIVDDYKIDDPREDFLSLFVIDSTGNSKFCSIYGSVIRGSKTTTDMSCYTAKPDMVWVVKNGAFTGVDGTSLNDYAKVKTKEKYPPDDIYVPGVGWKTNWDIWRDIILPNHVTTDEEEEAWNSRYNFENNNDDEKKEKKENNKKDKLPIPIPIIFPNIKPGETESESESESSATGGDPKPGGKDDGKDTEKDTEKDTQGGTGGDKVTDSGAIPGIAEKAGNWKNLFPFCIPWDIMHLIKSMKADKKAPRFTFKHTFKVINYTWTVDVDMSDYWKYIKIFRWGMTILFIIGLFFLTVKFTTFVYRMGS